MGGLKDGEGKGDLEGEVGDDMMGMDYYGFEHREEMVWGERGKERAFNHRSILTYR